MNDAYDFFQYKKIVNRRKSGPNYYNNISKDRYRKIQAKKIQTTMIGALAAFEQSFGYLWGIGQDKKTTEELRLEAIWESVRNKILDNGNAQIRAINKELDQYDMNWRRYNMSLKGR